MKEVIDLNQILLPQLLLKLLDLDVRNLQIVQDYILNFIMLINDE